MSGAGSGGGGGSSGTIDYPGYMKLLHQALYTAMQGAVAEAQAANPYDYIQAWAPMSMAARMQAAVGCFDEVVEGFDPFEVWQSLMGIVPDVVREFFTPDKYADFFTGVTSNRPSTGDLEKEAPLPNLKAQFDPELLRDYLKKVDTSFFFDSTELDKYIDQQKARLCDSTCHEIIPRYRRGMQNIGAVMTSAFKIGEALLWKKTVEDMGRLESEYKMEEAKKEKETRAQMLLQEYEDHGKLALTEYDYEGKLALQLHEGKVKLVLGDAEFSDGVAKTEAEYRGKLALYSYECMFKPVSDILSYVLQKIAWLKDVMHYLLEVERMGYTSMKEYTDSQNIYAIEKAKWPLEMYKYLMDALGSIASSAGTSYTTSSSGTSRIASGISGALTGASAGVMAGGAMTGVGAPLGAAVGGAVGLIGGLL